MDRRALSLTLAALIGLGGCGPQGAPQQNATNQAGAEADTVDIPQTVTQLPEGTTPMAQRVAVIGLLNKRNGLSRDLTLRPGQAIRVGDVIIRLRACETTAPWEIQQLTGAFVQVDVRTRQNQFQRVFSGWLYRESPSLNTVQHPIYDVWPKSCEMTHPGGGRPAESARPANNRSSASNSTPSPPADTAAAPPDSPPSAEANSAR